LEWIGAKIPWPNAVAPEFQSARMVEWRERRALGYKSGDGQVNDAAASFQQTKAATFSGHFHGLVLVASANSAALACHREFRNCKCSSHITTHMFTWSHSNTMLLLLLLRLRPSSEEEEDEVTTQGA